jgi:hypothetical protein
MIVPEPVHLLHFYRDQPSGPSAKPAFVYGVKIVPAVKRATDIGFPFQARILDFNDPHAPERYKGDVLEGIAADESSATQAGLALAVAALSAHHPGLRLVGPPEQIAGD